MFLKSVKCFINLWHNCSKTDHGHAFTFVRAENDFSLLPLPDWRTNAGINYHI